MAVHNSPCDRSNRCKDAVATALDMRLIVLDRLSNPAKLRGLRATSASAAPDRAQRPSIKTIYHASVTAEELATLYLEQGSAPDDGAPNALFAWERLICDEPERAWPVFEHVLRRVSDDDSLEQVWDRLRLLLHRHYDAFRERARDLLGRYERFALIAGPDALTAERYGERPFDREALIVAYRAMQRTFVLAREVDRLSRSDAERGLQIAVEIIHRGVARGWIAFDVMSPLGDVLANHGATILVAVESVARESVAVRRVLWRLKRQWSFRNAAIEVQERLEAAAGSTTDYTELDVPSPPAQPQLDADERIIEAWFEYEPNFWAHGELQHLCGTDPGLAWSITQDLLTRAESDDEIGAIAAGPLEDLLCKHSGLLWPEIVAKAHTDRRFVLALQGVWVFESEGEVYQRFQELMRDVGSAG